MRELRLQADMTVFDFAAASKVSIATISRIEAGPHAVQPLIAQRILRTLTEKLGREVTIKDIEGLEIAGPKGGRPKKKRDDD